MGKKRVGAFLEANSMTPYDFAGETRSRLGYNATYELAQRRINRVELETHNLLMEPLREVTGRDLGTIDWLEHQA